MKYVLYKIKEKQKKYLSFNKKIPTPSWSEFREYLINYFFDKSLFLIKKC